MVDIHSHLLPGVDDGVQTEEESLLLLQEYADAGFSHIICTPHLHDPYVETKIHKIRSSFDWFKAEAGKFGIKTFLGSELYMSASPGKYIPFLDHFQLIETNPQTEPLYLLDEVFKLQMSGLTIILAHVERYDWFTPDAYISNRLREMGVLFQVNVQMIKSPKVKKYLEKDWVDFIASDNHGKRRGAVDFALWNRYGDIQRRSMKLLGL